MNKIINHPVFSAPFRPMFILCSLQAIAIVTFWISTYFTYLNFHGTLLSAAGWHAHEMVFGFVLPLLAGFLLTASSHWTGKKAYQGTPLIILSLFWLVERFVVILPMNKLIVFALCQPFILYFMYLSFQMLKENKKNLVIFSLIIGGLFLTKNIMLFAYYLEDITLANHARDIGLHISLIMIVIMAGRLFPFFSNKRLPHVNVNVPTLVNIGSIVSCIPLLIPANIMDKEAFLLFNLMALVFNGARFYFWRPLQSKSQPLLAMLYLGYLWILIYFALNVSLFWAPNWSFSLAPLHTYAAGGLSGVALAMLYRVGLGHTGRDLVLGKLAYWAFFSLHLGALIRVVFPIIWPQWYMKSLHHASGWWTLAFIFYLWEFIPYFCKKHLKQ